MWDSREDSREKRKTDKEIRGTKNGRRNDSFVHTFARRCFFVSPVLKMRKIAPHQMVPKWFCIPRIIKLESRINLYYV